MASIYEQIQAAVGLDGTLPGNFELQTKEDVPGIILDEGPCLNLSQMEDRAELLLAYLAQAERAGSSREDLKTVEAVLEAAQDLPQVRDRARALLDAHKEE